MSDLYLTDEQYIDVLKRLRELIAKGVVLEGDDSDVPGCKYTYCSWGLCTGDPEFWKKDELMFPERAPINGAVSSKYSQKHHLCPLGKDLKESSGCFYKCLVFKGRTTVTRKKALALYDEMIRKVSVDNG